MRTLEFLEMLALVILLPFVVFVIVPFGVVWAIGRLLQLFVGVE